MKKTDCLRARRWRWRVEGAAMAALGLTLAGLLVHSVRQAQSEVWVQANALPRAMQAMSESFRYAQAGFVPLGGVVWEQKPQVGLEKAVSQAEPDELPAVLLRANDKFLALAARVESFRPNAYKDAAGWNIGFGYCISCRLKHGSATVRADLAAAGLGPAAIETLIHGAAAEKARVAISPVGAMHLLERLSVEARAAARRSIGPRYDALPEHRKAALAWLAYNTGAAGFAGFHRLHESVVEGRSPTVAQFTPWYRTAKGPLAPNRRAGEFLKAAYKNPEGLAAVVLGEPVARFGSPIGTDARSLVQ